MPNPNLGSKLSYNCLVKVVHCVNVLMKDRCCLTAANIVDLVRLNEKFLLKFVTFENFLSGTLS